LFVFPGFSKQCCTFLASLTLCERTLATSRKKRLGVFQGYIRRAAFRRRFLAPGFSRWEKGAISFHSSARFSAASRLASARLLDSLQRGFSKGFPMLSTSTHVYSEIYLHLNWHTKNNAPFLRGEKEIRIHAFLRACLKTVAQSPSAALQCPKNSRLLSFISLFFEQD
jgi:hypothetical protein